MTWLSNIFSKKQTSEIHCANPEAEEQEKLKELFVDETIPEVLPNAEKKGIDILQYLEQDFQSEGFANGYKFHSSEILETRLQAIKADFRLKIDVVIDQKNRMYLELQANATDIMDISERLYRQYADSMAEIHHKIKELENQRDLSSMNEGWIMKVIHEYKDGYLKGMQLYSEEKLLAISTGLFD